MSLDNIDECAPGDTISAAFKRRGIWADTKSAAVRPDNQRRIARGLASAPPFRHFTRISLKDRGPFVRGRVIDLTPAGARALGFSGIEGLARVKLEIAHT